MSGYLDDAWFGIFRSPGDTQAPVPIADEDLADETELTGQDLKKHHNKLVGSLAPLALYRPNRVGFALLLEIGFILGQSGDTRPAAGSVKPGFIFMDTANDDELTWSDGAIWREVGPTERLIDLVLVSLRNSVEAKVDAKDIEALKVDTAPVMFDGDFATLTEDQLARIRTGTSMVVSSGVNIGRTYFYSGTGSKTDPDSYVRSVAAAAPLPGKVFSVEDFGFAEGGTAAEFDAAWTEMIAAADAADGGTILLGSTIYPTNGDLPLADKVSVLGIAPTNGWARSGDYTHGSVIYLAAGANKSVFNDGSSVNHVIADVLIDVNGGNQAAAGLSGFRGVNTSGIGGGADGLVLRGVKIVNATGFSIYGYDLDPVDANECFFMHGVFMGECDDFVYSDCGTNATGGKTPSIYLAEPGNAHIADTLAFHWGDGEASTAQRLVSTGIAINTATDQFTVDSVTDLYDDMPVVVMATTTLPTFGGRNALFTHYMRQVAGATWELYDRPKDVSGAVKTTFTDAGSGAYIAAGTEDVVTVTSPIRLSFDAGRAAGGKRGGITVIGGDDLIINAIRMDTLNGRDQDDVAAIELLGTSNALISMCSVGSVKRANDNQPIAVAVRISDYAGKVAELNRVSALNVFSGAIKYYDDSGSSAPYEKRNMFLAPAAVDIATQRIVSPMAAREPGKWLYRGVLNSGHPSLTVAQNNATTVSLTQRSAAENPLGVVAGTAPSAPFTRQGTYLIMGQIAFDPASIPTDLARIAFWARVLIGGVQVAYSPTVVWLKEEVDAALGNAPIAQFGSAIWYSDTTADASISVEVLQRNEDGVALPLSDLTTHSFIDITKLADLPFAG